VETRILAKDASQQGTARSWKTRNEMYTVIHVSPLALTIRAGHRMNVSFHASGLGGTWMPANQAAMAAARARIVVPCSK
jgi:hypothetical protein